MSNDRLRESLDQLRAELAHGDFADPDVKARLRALVGEIEARLDEPEGERDHDTLVESLREGLRHFESRHRDAAVILNRLMASLGDAGI